MQNEMLFKLFWAKAKIVLKHVSGFILSKNLIGWEVQYSFLIGLGHHQVRINLKAHLRCFAEKAKDELHFKMLEI